MNDATPFENVSNVSTSAAEVRQARRTPGSAGHGAPGTDAPSRSTMLELERNKVKQVCRSVTEHEQERIKEKNKDRFVHAVTVTCRNWMCGDCKKKRGYTLRKRLLKKAELFKIPRLYTITINREWSNSPEDAYDYVNTGGFIPRLFRLMGVDRWLSVLEPQQETGDGWPHWHFLIDVADLPGQWYHKECKVVSPTERNREKGWCYVPHFFDLNRVHRLLRQWRIGEQCYLTVKREGFSSSEHAINYITKYLVKMPKGGYPEWMLKHPRIRFVNASRPVGTVVAEPKVKNEVDNKEKEKDKEKKKERKHKPALTPIERMAECGMEQIFLQYDESLECMIFCGRAKVIDPKTALKNCPWTVKAKDFDIETFKFYEIRGFDSEEGAWQYMDVWRNTELQDAWKKKVQDRLNALAGT